jgi:hypothetical protein
VANITLRSVKGSALTFQEADNNFSNLNTAKLENISEDTSPSLGGNLDVGANSIITTNQSGIIGIGGIAQLAGLPLLGEGSSVGAVTSAANSDLVLGVNNADATKPIIFIDNTNEQILLSVAAGDPIANFNDTNLEIYRPVIGAGLEFSSLVDGDITLSVSGTGNIKLNSIAYPKTDGTAGQVLSTNGSGVLSFTTLPSPGIASVSADTTPSLGGNLDAGANSIVTTDSSGFVKIGALLNLKGFPLNTFNPNESIAGITSEANANLTIGVNNADVNSPNIYINPNNITLQAPSFVNVLQVWSSGIFVSQKIESTSGKDLELKAFNNRDVLVTSDGTGNIKLNSIAYPKTDGTAGQVLTTNGSGVLSFTTLPSAGIASVSADTTPSLGGNLDVGANSITTTDSSGFVKIGGVLELAGVFPIGVGQDLAVLSSAGNSVGLVLGHNLGAETTGPNVIFGADDSIQFTINDNGILRLDDDQIRADSLLYNEKVHSLGTTSGTLQLDIANGNVQTVTLNGNITVNGFAIPQTGLPAGSSITLIIDTNGTNRTLTSSMKFAGGEKTLSTTDTTDIISIFYDGTNYWASLAKDFK